MLNRQWFAERPYLLAIFIAVLLVLWMLSGMFGASHSSSQDDQVKQADLVPKVKVERRISMSVQDSVELYGRTEPDRVATVKAEVAGRVIEVLAQEGAMVKKGDEIVKIALNNRQAVLTQAQALLTQREMEYQGMLKLNTEGYQGDVQLSQAKAALAAAKADIHRLKLNLNNTVVRAPFDGVLNTRYVEQGDYVKDGDNVAMIADLDPLVVRAHVTENQVTQLQIGQSANVKLLNKQQAAGEVRYIASVADDATNTFKIEVAIKNSGNRLLAGLSGEVLIPFDQVPAIKISPALLALDELGNVGVKTVVDNTVKFTPIDIVKTESDGIWLTGLGEHANIITLGQGFVRAGDIVESVFDTTTNASILEQ